MTANCQLQSGIEVSNTQAINIFLPVDSLTGGHEMSEDAILSRRKALLQIGTALAVFAVPTLGFAKDKNDSDDNESDDTDNDSDDNKSGNDDNDSDDNEKEDDDKESDDNDSNDDDKKSDDNDSDGDDGDKESEDNDKDDDDDSSSSQKGKSGNKSADSKSRSHNQKSKIRPRTIIKGLVNAVSGNVD